MNDTVPNHGLRKPPSVSFPQALLFVQAGCWALGAVADVFNVLVTPVKPLAYGVLAIAWFVLAVGLARAKFVLGVQLGHGGSERTRKIALGTELAMICLGSLWLALPSYAFILFGFAGACLSLAAVLCLLRPTAREYCASAVPGTTDSGSLPGLAGFWWLSAELQLSARA